MSLYFLPFCPGNRWIFANSPRLHKLRQRANFGSDSLRLIQKEPGSWEHARGKSRMKAGQHSGLAVGSLQSHRYKHPWDRTQTRAFSAQVGGFLPGPGFNKYF